MAINISCGKTGKQVSSKRDVDKKRILSEMLGYFDKQIIRYSNDSVSPIIEYAKYCILRFLFSQRFHFNVYFVFVIINFVQVFPQTCIDIT